MNIHSGTFSPRPRNNIKYILAISNRSFGKKKSSNPEEDDRVIKSVEKVVADEYEACGKFRLQSSVRRTTYDVRRVHNTRTVVLRNVYTVY